ncbi:MAG TPA: pyridoxal-dependent decarboxylase [Candidatus Limnocylindrales bacterium]|nr:pyridoxal-dependent decarboxylase [Candidatus Limnocylindrales bacterium]
MDDDPLGPFRWHPEPELIGIRDARSSRAALERAGEATWRASLDWLYDEAMVRAMGVPTDYAELRRLYFGEGGGPGAAPADPTTLQAVLDEFTARIAPHTLNSYHPRALSYFTPPPLVASIAGEVLAQWTNQGIDVWHAGPGGAFVEEEVVRWLCDLVGYGEGSFGLCTSGGVMANFIAMALVRDVHLRALRGGSRPPRGAGLENVRVYTGDQTHFSIARALDELGFPPETLAILPSDQAFRLHAAPVAEAIARDRAFGRTPVAICAVAGSTNTGSVDLVPELARLARDEGLWLHVDAAYGGAARLSARDAARVPGLDLADSVTVDPHKWFFQAYDLGALVVRDGDHLRQTFDRSPEYYRGGEGAKAGGDGGDAGVAQVDSHAGQLNFYKLGMEGTRRFRALKLWASWKHLGTSGLGRLVEMNDDIAAYLAARCAEADDLEAIPAEPELSVVCFRHLPGGPATAARMDPAALDAHQDRLASALEDSGDGWLSTTTLAGRTFLRAGVVNYLTTEADIDRILADLRRLAEGISTTR